MGLKKQMQQQVIDYKEKLARENEEKLNTAIEQVISKIDARVRDIVRDELKKC